MQVQLVPPPFFNLMTFYFQFFFMKYSQFQNFIIEPIFKSLYFLISFEFIEPLLAEYNI